MILIFVLITAVSAVFGADTSEGKVVVYDTYYDNETTVNELVRAEYLGEVCVSEEGCVILSEYEQEGPSKFLQVVGLLVLGSVFGLVWAFFWGKKKHRGLRRLRCCGKRFFRILREKEIERRWENFINAVFTVYVRKEHDIAVQPRQTLWHDCGEQLKLLKRTWAPAVYNDVNNTHLREFKRFFHDLGELLKRHPWAISKRGRKHLQNLPWRYGNGQLAVPGPQ